MTGIKLARALGLATALGASQVALSSELFFAFNPNSLSGSQNASLFLFGTPGQQATVSSLSGFNQTVTFDSQGVFNLAIPATAQMTGTGVSNKGFIVNSQTSVAGYWVNRAPFTTDMTYLFEKNSLGTNYVLASQGNGFGEGSQAMIIATENNTAVTFTPTGGTSINVTLQKGETYKYAGGATDLTGSFVTANKPVAVFGGHECAQVPVGNVACDNLIEQFASIDKLSSTYLVSASKPGVTNPDVVRVVATANGTQVKVNGVIKATLAAGQFYEFDLSSGAKIDATNPVMVAQYLRGTGNSGLNTDPAMAFVPGFDAWLTSYRLSTPSGAAAFATNYADVIVETSSISSLLLNGLGIDPSLFTAIAGTNYSRANVELAVGLFSMSAATPFQLLVGGGSQADSYFTFGGSSFAPGISDPPTPSVPLPLTGALLGLGLVGMGALRRSRKK